MGQQRNYNSDLKYADLDLVIERRVGFEPTVTIRSKHTFRPKKGQLQSLPPHKKKTEITVLPCLSPEGLILIEVRTI